MLDSIISSEITLDTFLICTAVSLVLGLGLAFVANYREKSSSSLAVTLAVLPLYFGASYFILKQNQKGV